MGCLPSPPAEPWSARLFGFEPISLYRPEVPEELDRAILVCLARDPDSRYSSALQLAEALEAGVHGEVTAATQRLEGRPSSSDDMTQALARTEAVSAQRVPDHLMPDRTQSIPPARRRAAPAAAPRRATKRRRLGNFIAGLAILAAGVLVVLAILQATGSPADNKIDESSVHDQVQSLQSYIRSHAE